MKKPIKIILTAITVLFLNITTSATSAHKVLMLRSGPGNHYQITAIIRTGGSISFNVCNPVWCHIRVGKVQAWVQTKVIVADPEQFAYHYRQSGKRNFDTATVGNVRDGQSLTIRLEIVRKEELKATEKCDARPNAFCQ